MKKILSIFLVLLTLVNILGSVSASEITTAGGNNDVPVELTQQVAMFSVTVPTVLPVDLDANGVVTVATDNKIINNSWGPVEVKGVSLTPLNDWVLVDFTTDFKNKKVGLKEFGFEINDTYVLTDGSCEATFDVIPGNSEINFSYDANVATQKQSLEDIQIAFVIFTIGWANNNINAIPVTSVDSNGNNLNATSTVILGDQKDNLLSSLDASGLANSSEVDYLINVKSDNFDGMADTTFDLSDIANEGDTVVILHYDETLEKWEYISTETVDANGMINADFSSYSPVAFIVIKPDITFESGVPGLYDAEGNLLCLWEDSGIDIEQDVDFSLYSHYANTSNLVPNADNSVRTIIITKYPTATKMIIPDSVSYIGTWAIADCDTLSEIIVGNGVKTMGYSAFSDNQGLKILDLGESLTHISSKGIVSCNYIEKLIIPTSVQEIGDYGLENVGCLIGSTHIYYKGTETEWDSIPKGSNWSLRMGNVVMHYNYSPVPDNCYVASFADNSWEDIIAACENNEVPDSWQVGDTKPMIIDGTEYNIQIIGKHHDVYSDGSGTAPLTLQLKELMFVDMNSKYQMSSYDNSCGWANSYSRTSFLIDVFEDMPSEIQASIKAVNKTTVEGFGKNPNSPTTFEITSDKLFLLSEYEVFGSTVNSEVPEGQQYAYYVNGGSTIKSYSQGVYHWWLRTPQTFNSQCFALVHLEGCIHHAGASSRHGISFAFCF